MTKLEQFTNAYIEALYWTETGPDSEYPSGVEITALTRCNALNDCARFFDAYRAQIGGNYEQAGHDFWLTRNRHGAGFWDRPELYGQSEADELTRAAHAMGEVYAEFDEVEEEETPADDDGRKFPDFAANTADYVAQFCALNHLRG